MIPQNHTLCHGPSSPTDLCRFTSCRNAYSYADVRDQTLRASTALSIRCIFMGWASSHLPAVPSCSQLTCEGSIVFSIHRSQLARHVEKTGTLHQCTHACRVVDCVKPVTCQLCTTSILHGIRHDASFSPIANQPMQADLGCSCQCKTYIRSKLVTTEIDLDKNDDRPKFSSTCAPAHMNLITTCSKVLGDRLKACMEGSISVRVQHKCS